MKKVFSNNRVILLLIIMFYLFWELRSITLPVFMVDEARKAAVSMGIIKNKPCAGSPYSHTVIFGRYIPLMLAPYHGVGISYLLVPYILLCGLSVFSIRFFAISSGLIILLLLYAFCKRFLNDKAAVIIVYLLAIDWSFIAGAKIGIHYGSTTNVFFIGSLLCFYEWYRKARKGYLCLGGFLAGFGLDERGWFLWYLIALVPIGICFLAKVRERFSKREMLISSMVGVIGFCIGALPLICYGIKSDFAFIRYGIEHFTKTEAHGFNNLQYVRHLSVMINKIRELPDAFWGPIIYHFSDRFQKFVLNNVRIFYFDSFVICLLWHILTFAFKKGNFLTQKKILLLLFGGMLMQSPFTLSNLSSEHLFLFWPIMKILLGLFLYEMMILSRWMKNISVLILMCLFVIHSFGLSEHHTLLRKNGGLEGHLSGGSDAIYNVVHYLTSKGIKNVVLMDGGLWHLVEVMSGWRITEKYYFQDVSSLDAETFHLKFNEQLEQELRNKDNVYLFHPPEFTGINCFGLFSQLAQRMNMQVRELERFHRKDGKIMYLIYRVEPRILFSPSLYNKKSNDDTLFYSIEGSLSENRAFKFSEEDFDAINYVYARLLAIKKRRDIFNSPSFLKASRDFLKTGKADWRCDAGKLYFSINPEGKTSICHKFDSEKTKGRISLREFDYERENLIGKCRDCLRPCWAEVTFLSRELKSSFEMFRIGILTWIGA